MTQNLSHPLIVRFETGKGNVVQSGKDVITVPAFSRKAQTMQVINNVISEANKQGQPFDYLALSFRDAVKQNNGQFNDATMNALHMRANWLMKVDNGQGRILPAINRKAGSQQLYLLNPQYDKEAKDFTAIDGQNSLGKRYVVPKDTVKQVYDEYGDRNKWEKHQAEVLHKFAQINPLSEEHTKMLESPKRGLKGKDLAGFFDWRSNQVVIPELMNDNMIGIPSIKATAFGDINVTANGQQIGTGSLLSLKTGGKSGFMIPMRNPEGNAPKYQVAADISKINLVLKAKAKDGISIQKSEYYDKKNGKYKFKFKDGKPSNLILEDANNEGATFKDDKGEFTVGIKEDIKPQLEKRGYDIPKIIDNIKPTPETKYIWMSRGDMIGPKAKGPNDLDVSPSNPGFITAKEPTNGEDKYIVMVAEGALKGVITSKYLMHPDKNGHSLGDKLAGDRGLIVAQVPGVAESFVKDVPRVYEGKKIAGTYIAMDADGRENRNVARGIAGAYDALAPHGKVAVLSWDPAQKGIDDALLAMAQGKITLEDMDIKFGTPEQLFPIEQAKSPIPYKLDGERAYNETQTPEWQREYHDDVKNANKEYDKAAQNDNQDIDILGKNLGDALSDLGEAENKKDNLAQ